MVLSKASRVLGGSAKGLPAVVDVVGDVVLPVHSQVPSGKPELAPLYGQVVEHI